MVYTSRNPIVIVNGGNTVRLDTLAYNIETRSGVATGVASARSGAVEVAGRTGSFYRPGAKREESTIVLKLWVSDDDVNGQPQSGYQSWRNNIDTLNSIFDTSTRQLEIREYVNAIASPSTTLVGKPYRRAFCEVRTVIEPDMEDRWFGPYVAELVNNQTYWEDDALTTFVSPTGTTAVATHTITALGGSTAPIEDALITVTGPITNPALTCPETGSTLRHTGTVAAGQQWCVNTKTYQSAKGTNIESAIWAGNVAGTSVVPSTVYSGPHSPTMFPIAGSPSPQVQLSGSGAGTGTNLKIAARKKYH